MNGMTSIVKNMTKLVAGFIALFGLYVVVTGHLSPGGGFAGGVIIMGGAVLVLLAFGSSKAKELVTEAGCHVVEGLGAFAFLLIAILGLWAGGFFVNFVPHGRVHEFFSGGSIILSNLAIAAKVAAGLTGIFLALVIGCRQAMPKES